MRVQLEYTYVYRYRYMVQSRVYRKMNFSTGIHPCLGFRHSYRSKKLSRCAGGTILFSSDSRFLELAQSPRGNATKAVTSCDVIAKIWR